MVARARRPGRGSVYRDAGRDRWVGAIDSPRPDGTRRRKKFYRPTCEQAEVALDAWLAEHPRQGPILDGRAVNLARARQLGTHAPAEWYAKVHTYGGRCHYCKRSCVHSRQKDHMVPVCRGGSDGIDNVVPACRDCNAAKGTMTAEEFAAWAQVTGFFSAPRQQVGSRAGAARLLALPPLIRELALKGAVGG